MPEMVEMDGSVASWSYIENWKDSGSNPIRCSARL